MAALCHHSGRGWRFSVATHSSPDVPTKTGQMHVHWHKQAWTTNGDAMPAVLDRPSLWPTDSRTHEPPLTNGLRSQLREQATGRGHDCPRALDKCAALTGLGKSGAVHVSTLTPGETVGTNRRDQCGVNGELSTIEEWKPVSHDFQSSTTVQVQVPNEQVGGDAGTCLVAHPCSSAFDREAAIGQYICPRARCEDRGKGSHKRRRRSTRKS